MLPTLHFIYKFLNELNAAWCSSPGSGSAGAGDLPVACPRRGTGGGITVTERPAGRDVEAVGRFVERFASVLVEAGMPPMPSRVFAALLVTEAGRLTAAELSAQLGASPAAISGAVRYLGQLGMITRQREPGSRRDVYLVLDGVWYEVAIRRDQVLNHWVSAAEDGVGLLGPDTRAGRRMADSLDFFQFLLAELPAVLARWQERKDRREPASRGTAPAAGPGR
ncbi:MAG: MarR family transcriptional regulator [Actinobacteria bacterium]|nr:MarR family transcriptional regulator [Actinomycetota bacterium]